MRRKSSTMLLFLVFVLAITPFLGSSNFLGGGTAYAAGTKIALSTSNITLESGGGDPTTLVDEQSLAGDPRFDAANAGQPTTKWMPGFQTGQAPAYAVLDLGQTYDIDSIYVYDLNGNSNFDVYAGSTGNWSLLFTDPLTFYNHWNAHTVSTQTRYLRIMTNNAYVGEIVVYGTPTVTDSVAPKRIDTLTASSPTSNSVSLSWTAVGDDNNSGTATSYDVRYNMSYISSTNWATSTQATGEPTPAAPGTPQSMTVTGLSAGVTYYFAIKAVDDVGNVSSLSTIASATTNVSASDTTAPADVTNLAVGSPTGNSMSLTWTAPGDDGSTGTATSYDIRYSTTAITSSNFASAAQVTGAPAPALAGSSQSLVVSGLSSNTLYYFAMKASDEVPNASGLSNVVNATTSSAGTSLKITLTPDMLIDENDQQDKLDNRIFSQGLIDEQVLAGDPRAGTSGAPQNGWYFFLNQYAAPNTGQYWWLPASAYLDFGRTFHITDIYFYDVNASSTNGFVVDSGTPFHWSNLFTDNLGSYNAWRGKQVNVDTRYLRFGFANTGANINEIVVYGYPVGTPDTPPSPTAHTNPAMETLIGTNAVIDDTNAPNNDLNIFKTIREYHNWSWDGNSTGSYPSSNNYQFNPSFAGGGWNFDNFYSTMKSNGSTVSPDFKVRSNKGDGFPSWMSTLSSSYKTPIAALDSYSSTTPQAYGPTAEHLFQFAARYGSSSVASTKLKLASNQPVSTGLNAVNYMEVWNEENDDWDTRKFRFMPYEYAAMLSAAYDGHQGTMGTGAGIKTADPNMKVVLGGIAGYNLNYVNLIKSWANEYRTDGKFPADVLNFHIYCQINNTTGISPEACGLRNQTETLTAYRDTYMPGKEVWISEFGYDTNQQSEYKAPPIGSYTAYEVQGQWLVRSYLALAAAGIDKAMQFQFKDDYSDTAPGSKYGSSGVVGRAQDGYPRKTSWYYVNTMIQTLTGKRFLADQASGDANVMIYKFKSTTDNSGIYAIWAPTSNGTTVSSYQLTLAGSPTTANLVSMVDGDADGTTSSLTISGGKVTVNVSERPIFVKVNAIN
ncbi:fibronectin type III domain-containing protein [Paenibacillus plantarum]|uniref:fibronectin type III domain-containing protein n=1 Tax=Paenibacillus plantarum TaxID=2654975 RepID=UPI0014918D7E|nr:fibronectin type III domain-containing protein [Paenibacillus plantarum]